jgi:hypothetical protein
MDGSYLMHWGTSGSADGQFNWPNGVTVDANGSSVFVCDGSNHRVQVFSYGPTSIGSRPPSGDIALKCVPNPFTSTASISFVLPAAAKARVDVYDVRGRLVTELLDQHLPAGPHDVQWPIGAPDNGRPVSGVYFVRVEAGQASAIQRLVLIR